MPDILDIFTKKFLSNDTDIQDHTDEHELINNLKTKWDQINKFQLQISARTIRKLCKSLNNGMGPDGIHSFFLNQAFDKLLDNVACFINSCYKHCFIPINTLKGELHPTLKDLKGNISESSNYRPVMQSSCIFKIIELHILSILEEKVSFNFRQFGFKKVCSTTDACFVLKETIHKYLFHKGKAFAAFIDLSKAFDKVDHLLLEQQVLDRNIPPDIVFLLMHYLRNQSARVCWNEGKGQYLYIEKGVRQGGILSPFLFKLYVDNLISNIAKKNVGCQLGLLRLNIIAYADDLVILADTVEHLEYLYGILDEGIGNLKLLMIKTKSKCMIFQKTNSKDPVKEIRLGNYAFEVVRDYKYLGHVVNKQLLDDPDVGTRLNSFYAKFNSAFRNFKNVSIETFLFLFNAYCLSDYGLGIWDFKHICNKQIFKSFEIAFSNALKKIVGALIYSSSHITADLCSQLLLKHHVSFIQARYMKRISASKNEVIEICWPFLKTGYLSESPTTCFIELYECDL